MRLNRDAGAVGLPALYFFTDPKRTPDPLAVAARLPKGTAVVYRHFGAENRREVAKALAALCWRHGLVLLIAADPALARKVGAHGVHWPEARARKRVGPGLLTMAAHSEAALRRAALLGMDAVFLSPVFPTRSGSMRPALGLNRASALARGSAVPVIALGGVNASNAHRLLGRGFAGLASVDGLLGTD